MRPRTYASLALELVNAAPEGINANQVWAALKLRGFKLDRSSAGKALKRLSVAGEIGMIQQRVQGGLRLVYCPLGSVDEIARRIEAERLQREREAAERRKARNRDWKRHKNYPQADDDRPFIHRWTGYERIASHQLAACVRSVWELAERA